LRLYKQERLKSRSYCFETELILPKQWLRKEFEQWLPAYAGGTVHGLRRLLVKLWLDHDDEARRQLKQVETLRAELQRQPQKQPSTDAYFKIQAAIAQEVKPATRPARLIAAWVAAIVIALATLLLVWQALPPGISLEWSVQGELPKAFRVYRAPISPDSPAPSQPFTLLDELQAKESAAAYQFTDWLPLPGQNYVYRVEALDQLGQPTASQTVVGRGLDALAGQLLTLAALGLLLLSLVLIVLGKHRPYSPSFFQAV
jgi:hypothetical protein